MSNETTKQYLAVVQNAARLVYLGKKLNSLKGQETSHDLITEYIKLTTWFEELGIRKGAPQLRLGVILPN